MLRAPASRLQLSIHTVRTRSSSDTFIGHIIALDQKNHLTLGPLNLTIRERNTAKQRSPFSCPFYLASSSLWATWRKDRKMDTTHRKIELQSPLDLLYLQSNASALLRSKLDLHFPPSAAPPSASDDILKSRVEELCVAYVDNIFASAKENLSVNGLEGTQMEEAIKAAEQGEEEQEAYDTKLGIKLLSLSSQIEAMNLQLATLRREAPAKAAAAYASALSASDAAFAQSRVAAEEARRQKLQEEQDLCGASQVRDWDECEANWRTATEGLVNVKEGIGATSARLVQARDVVEYLDQKGGAK